MAKGWVQVGVGMRGEVRLFLARCELHGLTWKETKGFLESVFNFEGPAPIVGRVLDSLTAWSKQVGAAA